MTSKTYKIELELTEYQQELLLDALNIKIEESIAWGGDKDVKDVRDLRNYVFAQVKLLYPGAK